MKIIMISGVPGTGKTTLAYRLALELSIDKVLSMDALKNAARAFLNPPDHPYLFVDSHRAYAVAGKPMIDSYLNHSAAVNKLLLDTLEYTKDNLVIADGVTLHADFAKEVGRRHRVLHVNLTLSEAELRERYAMKSRLRPDAWSDNLPRILEIQDHLVETSSQNLVNSRNSPTLERMIEYYEETFSR